MVVLVEREAMIVVAAVAAEVVLVAAVAKVVLAIVWGRAGAKVRRKSGALQKQYQRRAVHAKHATPQSKLKWKGKACETRKAQ